MMHLVVRSGDNRDKINQLIDSFDTSGESIWKKRNTIKIFEMGDRELCIKSFKIPHLINRFAYRYVRKSKARRSFEHAEILLSRGIPTPEPIAYKEEFDLLGLKKSHYISENLKYDFDFNALYDENLPDRDDILEQFTEFTFRLHERGIHHLDHSRGNTLIVKKGDGHCDFYLIDLNRMQFEEMDYRKRIDNFSRLGLKPDMIAVISRKYAELIGEEEQKVLNDITESCQAFDQKRAKKKGLKRKLGLSEDS
jgi:RIO-like serine/threonine protein kinase